MVKAYDLNWDEDVTILTNNQAFRRFLVDNILKQEDKNPRLCLEDYDPTSKLILESLKGFKAREEAQN